MLKPIKYVEVSLNKSGVKEKGLFLNYDETTKMIRLILDNKNTTGTYSLQYITASSILVKDAEGLIDRMFSVTADSQKLAEEYLLEISHQLKTENKLNASGFVNISAYTEIPYKYTKDATLLLPIVPNTVVGKSVYTPPKIGFLATKYVSTAVYVPVKKITIIFRKSDLPTEKLLAAMEKKAAAAFNGTYKLKAAPLNEEDTELEKEAVADMAGLYGSEGYDDYWYSGMHERMKL